MTTTRLTVYSGITVRDQWKAGVITGARLLALRASRRCSACEHDLADDELYREPIADSERRVRADYCCSCVAQEDYPAHVWRDRNAIRRVLDAAAPALTEDSV